MSKVKVYLPNDPQESNQIVSDYLEKGDAVTLTKENGKVVAEVEDKKQQLEIHPTTGLPILHD